MLVKVILTIFHVFAQQAVQHVCAAVEGSLFLFIIEMRGYDRFHVTAEDAASGCFHQQRTPMGYELFLTG